ncbi:MAG: dihydrodipicolinate synthase family protein [Methanosarcinaceae archaeon]|nr:dihydrodipicolinate synthase family protein [Methanosarcinaceae archaeon]
MGIALGSEVMSLTEGERDLVARTVTTQVKGRMPVVVNTGGASTCITVFNSVRAQENGADAVMIIPPALSVGPDTLADYYKAVGDVVDLPIFIQDLSNPHVSAETARRIAEVCPNVRYIKVESHPTPVMVGEVMAKAADILTVFGGGGGRFIIEELRRGSQGTMPGCSNPESFVKLWAQYAGGDERAAVETFYREIEPINRIAEQGWGAFHGVHKEILRQRGIIKTAVVRGPVHPLDKTLLSDLQIVYDQMYT